LHFTYEKVKRYNVIRKIIFTISLAFLIAATTGQSYAHEAELVTAVRPDPEGTPTKVYIGIYLTDLSNINSVKQTFAPNFIMIAHWKDPHLASKSNEKEGTYRHMSLNEIWNPRFHVMNQQWLHRLFSQKDVVWVSPDGEVVYMQQFYGDLTMPMHFKNFPFDKQTMPITIVSGGFGPKSVEFIVDSKRTGRNDVFSIADWEVGEVKGASGTYYVKGHDREFSQIEFTLPARRHAGFFVSRVIMPLILIVIMSFTVFWIDPKDIGPQLGIAATSMLTIIAFQFAVNNSLPRIFYLTRIDLFILFSTTIVFLVLIESITTSTLARRGNAKLALAIDMWAKWIFPPCFILLGIYTLLIY